MRHQTNNIADEVQSFKAIAFPKQDRVPCSTARAAQEELEEGDKDLKLSTRHSRFPEPKLIDWVLGTCQNKTQLGGSISQPSGLRGLVTYALVPQPVRVQWDPKGSGSFWSDRCSIRSGSCDFAGLSMTKSFHHFIFNDPLRCCYQTRLTKIFM